MRFACSLVLADTHFYSGCLNARLMMRHTDAETLALKGLAFLASDRDLLLRFLTATGLELPDLRARAGESELLAAVMDFLLGEETLLMQFAEGEGIEVKEAYAARRALPGADAL